MHECPSFLLFCHPHCFCVPCFLCLLLSFISLDAWFDEFVYQIVVSKELLPAEILQVLQQEPVRRKAERKGVWKKERKKDRKEPRKERVTSVAFVGPFSPHFVGCHSFSLQIVLPPWDPMGSLAM